MPPRGTPRRARRSLALLGALAAFALALFAALWLLDYFFIDAATAHRKDGPFGQLFDFDALTMQNALGSLSQVIAAVLGIAITVVSIVVQLAATRYTSRVADLFFRDKINLGRDGLLRRRLRRVGLGQLRRPHGLRPAGDDHGDGHHVVGEPADPGPLLRLRVRLPRPREGHRPHRRADAGPGDRARRAGDAARPSPSARRRR